MTDLETYNEKVFEKTTPDFENPDEKNRAGEALGYAHEIRQFEISLYWRRSLIFWGFTLAFFVGLTAIISLERENWEINAIALLISYLGLFTTWAWYFIETGSKSWQNNWEKHIDFLEDQFTGKLHKTTIGDIKKFYSISSIHKTFIFVMIIFWILIVGLMTSQSFDDLNFNCWLTNYGLNFWWLWFLGVAVIYVAIIILVWPPYHLNFFKSLKYSKVHKIFEWKIWKKRGHWRTSFKTIPKDEPSKDVTLITIPKDEPSKDATLITTRDFPEIKEN